MDDFLPVVYELAPSLDLQKVVAGLGDFATLLEESILMAVTVLLAIWALHPNQPKSGSRVVGEHNALPFGIAFGYSYAGSVSMLTVTFEDIRGVMMLGHALTLLTVLIIIKSIKSTINSYGDAHERDIIKQTPENELDGTAEISKEENEQEFQEKKNDEESSESKESNSSSGDMGDNVNWDSPKETSKLIGKNED